MNRKKIVMFGMVLVLVVVAMEFAALQLGSLELPLPQESSSPAVADPGAAP